MFYGNPFSIPTYDTRRMPLTLQLSAKEVSPWVGKTGYGEDTFAVTTYPGAIVPEELSPERKYSGDYYPHPALISLQKGEGSSSQLDPEPSNGATPAPSGQLLPSLVLPIGQLQEKPNGETDDEFVNTDYVLVIDAVTTSHPVWLIYDRNAEDDLGEPRIVDPDEQPLYIALTNASSFATFSFTVHSGDRIWQSGSCCGRILPFNTALIWKI
ncbi:hypothetical protein FACUT_4318 [Fusarium acutatum]|uniref:Uncharacterized protein n=1 Tax=Fusarium acutatum TaxID=78861 RepID=A0A8H4JWA8_9HYPO|nr:hypothetical protein FACUT_4318 [Fusarium acutatum]